MIKKSFTLVELMIVIAILAILSAIVIFTLNPSRLFDNFRDTRRVTDISSIHKAINFMESWNESAINYGNSNTLYISLPDTSSTCSSYTLPTLPSGYIYSCKPTSTYKNTDSTGWIPIDFTVTNSNSYLSSLPTDPVNDTTYFYSYYPGGSYEVAARLSRPNTYSVNDEGVHVSFFEMGSPNREFLTPGRGIVGYWKLDEGSGDVAYDKSGYANNATLVNSPSWIILSDESYALAFNGETNYAETLGDSRTYNDYTISMWANHLSTTSTNTQNRFFGVSGFGTYTFMGLTNIVFHYNPLGGDPPSTSLVSNTSTSLNTWFHIAVTVDSDSSNIFINGLLKNYNNVIPSKAISTKYFFGSQRDSVLSNSAISEVAVFSPSLTSEEVFQMYNKTKYKYQ